MERGLEVVEMLEARGLTEDFAADSDLIKKRIYEVLPSPLKVSYPVHARGILYFDRNMCVRVIWIEGTCNRLRSVRALKGAFVYEKFLGEGVLYTRVSLTVHMNITCRLDRAHWPNVPYCFLFGRMGLIFGRYVSSPLPGSRSWCYGTHSLVIGV